MAKAPDRGSFPLDHFHECDDEAKKYSECVVRHQLIPKRCRDYQVKYLECRMKSGLMEHEEMSKLGFIESNSWETEDAEKKFLFDQINKIKKEAWNTVVDKNKDKPRMPPVPKNGPQAE